jgi:hypothetical protein
MLSPASFFPSSPPLLLCVPLTHFLFYDSSAFWLVIFLDIFTDQSWSLLILSSSAFNLHSDPIHCVTTFFRYRVNIWLFLSGSVAQTVKLLPRKCEAWDQTPLLPSPP